MYLLFLVVLVISNVKIFLTSWNYLSSPVLPLSTLKQFHAIFCPFCR